QAARALPTHANHMIISEGPLNLGEPPRIDHPGAIHHHETHEMQRRVKNPAASGGAFRAGGHYADIARFASTCPSAVSLRDCVLFVAFPPTASSGAACDISRRRDAHAAAAPKTPSVAVGCQPLV